MRSRIFIQQFELVGIIRQFEEGILLSSRYVLAHMKLLIKWRVQKVEY